MKDYPFIKKVSFSSIAQRRKAASEFWEFVDKNTSFLLIGHQLPDEDCVSSIVATAILLKKIDKNATIFFSGRIPEQISFLWDICKYNSIPIFTEEIPADFLPQAIIVLDTPKPSMIDASPRVLELLDNPSILKAEVDHHISADSACIKDLSVQFITTASSTSEIIAYLMNKLKLKKGITHEYDFSDILSRNLILAILTGIIGDTKTGVSFASHRDRRFYEMFLHKFEALLNQTTFNEHNLSNLGAVNQALEFMSKPEKAIFNAVMKFKKQEDDVSYIVLSDKDSRKLISKIGDYAMFVNVARMITDEIAEESKKVGLTIYLDETNPKEPLYQGRIRRARDFSGLDLRTVLEILEITNGGGHPGAIGFRIRASQVENIFDFSKKIIETLNELLSAKN